MHVYEAWHEQFRDYLRLRDHLRAEPESARAYAALKLRLAKDAGGDRRRYQEAKSPFIERLLATLR